MWDLFCEFGLIQSQRRIKQGIFYSLTSIYHECPLVFQVDPLSSHHIQFQNMKMVTVKQLGDIMVAMAILSLGQMTNDLKFLLAFCVRTWL